MWQQLRAKCFLRAQEGAFIQVHLLRPLSGLWACGAFVKNALYEHRFLPIHRLPAVVVSVGSIVAGGGGKTPLTLMLAQTLRAFGQVAILSRGYRAKRSTTSLGDEPELLNRRFGRPIVYSGKDRVALGRRAIQDGAKVLILDDGFQYRRLHRDFELLVVDGAEPFGFGAFLPRGLLRDPISRLREADALFVKNAQLCAEFRCLKIQMQPKVKRIVDLRGIPTKLFSDVKVGVFCAIANPKRFFSTVESLGAIEVERWILPDHERADLQMLERFAQRCRAKGAKAILCTEKDAVKLPPQLKLSLPLYYLEMELEFVTGLSEWQKLIEKISLSINNLHQSSSRK